MSRERWEGGVKERESRALKGERRTHSERERALGWCERARNEERDEFVAERVRLIERARDQ